MCFVDYAEGDGVSFGTVMRRAAKPHRCDECGREIAKGEQYEIFTWLDKEILNYVDIKGNKHGAWTRVFSCVHCIAARRWLRVVCSGWLYAAVRDDLKEHWDEIEVPRTVAFGRILIGIEGRWKYPRADRMIRVEEIERWVDQALEALKKPLAA